MLSFDFDTWCFTFGEGDGTLNGNNAVYLKEILSPSDVYTIQDLSTPIIRKTGIQKLLKWAQANCGVKEVDRTMLASPAYDQNHVFWVGVIVKYTDKDGNSFTGDGEASYASTKPGVAQSYLLAMASKRASSRAILNYLGIEAYDEDEAPSFSRVSLRELSEDDIAAITEPLGRKFLSELIPALAKKLDPPLENGDLGRFVRHVLGLQEDQDIVLDNLTNDDFVKIITAIEINRTLNAETLNRYIGQ